MGHTIYFQNTEKTQQTLLITMSYSFNAYYYLFNPTLHSEKTGTQLQQPLTDAIASMKRQYHTLTESKDPLKAVPGNYVQLLQLMLNYAKQHPTWVFHCE